ncbi:group II intron maturase-specific domain-containing protein [Candidatus Hydrogenedentota bacterium]
MMASVTKFIEGNLKLKVNQSKSALAYIKERKFLGYRLLRGGKLGIAPKSLERAKERIRQVTRRNRGISFEETLRQLNNFLTGWVTYYRHAKCKTRLQNSDQCIRRKLRCYRAKTAMVPGRYARRCERRDPLLDFHPRSRVDTEAPGRFKSNLFTSDPIGMLEAPP